MADDTFKFSKCGDPHDFTVAGIDAKGQPLTRASYEAFAEEIRKSWETENYQKYLRFSEQMQNVKKGSD